MKIEQILIQPIGQRFNAGTLTIKTCKKTWQVRKVWYHQVVFMDNTGEIPADVKIGEYLPLKRGQEVNLIIVEVRDAEYLGKPRKILFVEQYSLPSMTMDEYNSQEEDWHLMRQDEIRGKVRHGLTCAFIQSGQIKPDITSGKEHIPKFAKAIINELVDFIMTGK